MSRPHLGIIVAALVLSLAACSDASPPADSGQDARGEAVGIDGGGGDSKPGDADAAPDASVVQPCPTTLDESAVNPAGGTAKALWLKTLAVGVTADYDGASGGGGTFYLGGTLSAGGGTVNATFGGKPVTVNQLQGFVALLDASGAVQQVLTATPLKMQLAADADGVYAIFGWVSGDVTVGTSTASAVAGKRSLVVARITKAGAVSWVKAFGSSTKGARKQYFGIDGAQRLHVAELHDEKVSFGGSEIDCDVSQLVIDKAGAIAHSRCITKARGSIISLEGFAVDAAGDVTVGGFPGASYDLGFGVRTIDASTGGSVIVKVAYDGTPKWEQRSTGAYLRVRGALSGDRVVVVGHVPQWGARSFALAGDQFPDNCSGAFDRHISVLDANGKRLSTVMHGGTLDNVFVGAQDSLLLVLQPTAPFLPGNAATRYSAARVDGSKLSWLQDIEQSGATSFAMTARSADETGRMLLAGFIKGRLAIDKGDVVDHGTNTGDFVLLIGP
ncbi:MAG: hypothetical protein KC503_10725 [Myxococcales bacterium]|nr:hypothetical protein [Myxococcales bacterium]